MSSCLIGYSKDKKRYWFDHSQGNFVLLSSNQPLSLVWHYENDKIMVSVWKLLQDYASCSIMYLAWAEDKAESKKKKKLYISENVQQIPMIKSCF